MLYGRSLPRYQIKPMGLRVNWSHPIADRLIRAWIFTDASLHGAGASSRVLELCRETLDSGDQTRDDIFGQVHRFSAGAGLSNLDHPELTPSTAQGSGGMSFVTRVNREATGVADQICHKYQSSNLEYVFGWTSADVFHSWWYDNTASAFSGRTAPSPSSGVWHDLVVTWDGAIPPRDNMKMWQNSLRIDNANSGSGTFTQVRDTTSNFQLGGNNPGLGTTTGLRMDYFYLFRRALMPDEILTICDDPYCILTLPRQRYSLNEIQSTGAARSRFFFFFR